MVENGSRPKLREGTALWLLKIAGGVLIIVILGIHFVVNHLAAPGGLLTYQDVINYYRIPLVPVMEIVFLVLVVSHSLIGLRSILLDLNPSDGLLKVIDWLLILVGAGASVYGAWLVLLLASKGS